MELTIGLGILACISIGINLAILRAVKEASKDN